MTSSSESAWRIVPYQSHYLPALRRLFLESRRAAFHWHPADQFKLYDLDEMIEGEQILLALLGQEPIGFVAWWPPADFVHHLFIAPAHLRRGIGRALLQGALDQLGRPVRLKCLCRNEKAFAFYIRLGWEVEQREAGENGEYYAMILRE